jgi:integrase/recombinase XerC
VDGRGGSGAQRRAAVKEPLRAFLAYLRLNRNASAHTVSAYESDLTQFLAFAAQHLDTTVGNLDPTRLDIATIRAFLGELYKQGQPNALDKP